MHGHASLPILSMDAHNDFKSIFIIRGGPGESMTPLL